MDGTNTVPMDRSRTLLLLGMVVVALNLRPAIASVSPVLEAIRGSLAVSYTALSLLTTIPTLCMSAFAFTVPAVAKHVGRERGVFWGVVLIAVATSTRLGGRNALVLFGSTVLVGVGIAVSQALLPSLVADHFPRRESFATGLYTASLSAGAALAGGLTAPIGEALDSWPAALAVWAILAWVAIPVWWRCRRRGPIRRDRSDPDASRARFPWRHRWAWVLVLFFGGSSAIFFFVLTWLAPRYVALGWPATRAGVLLSVFVVAQIGGNLAVSAVGDRLTDKRPLFAAMALLLVGGALGVTVAPELFPWGWTVALGVGSAGLFTLSLILPVIYTSGPTATEGLSSLMLGGGYLVAALGPVVGGALRDGTGGYAAAFGAVVALGTVLLGMAVLFGPDRRRVPAIRPEDS